MAEGSAQKITLGEGGKLRVPDQVLIPYIEGDGVGPDVWRASQMVFDAAIKRAFQGKRSVTWVEILAGEKSFNQTGNWLPDDTLTAIKEHKVAIKGPLTTPVGGGVRSINVTLRQVLDLYACVRPIRYFPGVPSPAKRPQDVNMIVFRENTEDVYAGIEFQAGSAEAKKLAQTIEEISGKKIREGSAIGIKPISEFGSKRLIAMAIEYAVAMRCTSVTLVHKGNIMKFTEGGFREWGYKLAKEKFAPFTISEEEVNKNHNGAVPPGKILIKDCIADNMFQQVQTRPKDYSVIATTNLNGDYLSDALAAQVGGLGLAPGANIGVEASIFEATHGTAPKYAGKDKVNPGSLMLSGKMMFEHLGWTEVGKLIEDSFAKTIGEGIVTYDLARGMEKPTEVSCSGFAEAMVSRM